MALQKRPQRRSISLLAVWVLIGGWTVACSSSTHGQAIPAPGTDAVGENQYPNSLYYVGLNLYREGALSDATTAFSESLRQTRRGPSGRWIDAIPVHAMLGECLYQSGDLAAATEQFDAALQTANLHRGWTNYLDWAAAMSAANRAPSQAASWAGNNTPSLVPLNQFLQLATGSNNVTASYGNGSFESARTTLMDANEILKGIALALYRRAIIFGPLSADYDIARNTIAALERPTHATGRSIIGCVYTCGHFATLSEKEVLNEVAISSTLAGQVHPLTPLALLAAARVLASQDQLAEAIPVALRAAAAASALDQPEWVNEAMLIVAGCVTPEIAPTIQSQSMAIANSHLRRGRIASLGALLAATEASLVGGDTESAQMMINQASTLFQNREIFFPRGAAACDLLIARVAAAQGSQIGDNQVIDQALSRALGFANGKGLGLDGKPLARRSKSVMFATPRLFQLSLVGLSANERGIGGRNVDERLEQFVSEGTSALVPPAVWRADHLDALAFESHDLTQAMTAYLVSKWKRNPPLDVLVQSDALARRRFLATLPLGGRLQQVRRLAATEQDLLVEAAAAVLVKPPPTIARMMEILALPAPLAGTPESTLRGKQLESLAAQTALDRGPLTATMPPPLAGQSDLSKLSKGTALLSFVYVGDAFIGTLAVNGNVKVWSTQASRGIADELSKLLRGIGAIASRSSTRIDPRQAWRNHSATLRERLIPDEAYAAMQSAERVIVVPDGVLWYLPFELLGHDETASSLWADRYVVTYAPTPGLAIHDVAHNRPDRATGVYSTLFFSPRDAEANAGQLETVTAALQLVQILPSQPPVPTSMLGESVGQLAVFGVVTPNVKEPLLTTPGLYDATTPGGTLASWLQLPSQLPTQVILPGYRTAASSPNLGDGSELAWTLTAMHCSGVRNVLLSRWPVGGESTSILFKEFLQELPYDDTHAAWHRAVTLIRNRALDPTREPLLQGKDAAIEELTGDTPLFWAGYLLDASGAN